MTVLIILFSFCLYNDNNPFRKCSRFRYRRSAYFCLYGKLFRRLPSLGLMHFNVCYFSIYSRFTRPLLLNNNRLQSAIRLSYGEGIRIFSYSPKCDTHSCILYHYPFAAYRTALNVNGRHRIILFVWNKVRILSHTDLPNEE